MPVLSDAPIESSIKVAVQIRIITHYVALTIMLGWLLWIGKPVLLPIIAALISVYVLSTAAMTMERLPLVGRLPGWVHRTMVLLAFAAGVVLLFLLVINNLAQVSAALVRYEANLDALATRFASLAGIEDEPTWENLRRVTFDQIDFGAWVAPALASLRGFGTLLFLTVLYAAFFMAERGVLARKLVMLVGDEEASERTLILLRTINQRIGGYLSVKTVVNVILGAVSYLIMLGIGLEFALFWAVLIAFLNYIPYLGSLIGVVFPTLLSLAQFGSIGMAALTFAGLTVAQMFVGAYLEPRMMGRAFNLSPFAVLLALAFWSTLWGLPGAVLAVPMTASLVLLSAAFPVTRPVAVMLSANGRV